MVRRDDRARKKKKKARDSSLRLRRKKTCYCCENQVLLIDYKDEKLLGRFVSDRGKIVPRRISGACARHQRGVAAAVKRSRSLGILPYVAEQVQ
ncbi:MAG: 30S ribosomal protein S18 [Gemmatimonadetes bacterium]|nr:30S ribosomal protein S18 [Gemmatimonadota bacterium]